MSDLDHLHKKLGNADAREVSLAVFNNIQALQKVPNPSTEMLALFATVRTMCELHNISVFDLATYANNLMKSQEFQECIHTSASRDYLRNELTIN